MLRKLASQTAVYGTSAILSKFLNYLLTPYLTRIMIEPVYGQVSDYYSVIPFANVVLTMGLATGYFRYINKCESEGDRKRLFTTVWGFVSMLSVLFFAFVLMFRGQIATAMDYGQVTWYLVVTGALIMVDNIAAIPLASLRQQGRALRYTVVNVTGVVVNVACCVLLYSFIPGAKSSPGWVLVANLIASTVSLLMLLPGAFKMIGKLFSRKLLLNILAYSIPLMIAGLMGTASDFIDRQMLKFMIPGTEGLAQMGIYSAVGKIAALMVIFRQIYTLGAEPFFLQKFPKEEFLRMNAAALKYFTIAGLGIFLGIIFFKDIVALLVGARFREGMDILPLLLAANLFWGLLVNLSFWYKIADVTRYAIYVTVIGLALTVILNLVLIPMYGYVGSAWARAISALLMVVVSYIFNQAHYRVPYDMKRIGFYFLLAGAMYAISIPLDSLTAVLQYSLKILLLLGFGAGALKIEKINLTAIWKK